MNGSIAHVAGIWAQFLKEIDDWQSLVQGKIAKPTGCGPVYELENPIEDRPNESFAIADMRGLTVTEPHYHPNETEIYIVIQGSGTIVVGEHEKQLRPGVIIITPPDTAHFVIPEQDLVLGVVNTPPFKPENYVAIQESNPEVLFDKKQFNRLRNA